MSARAIPAVLLLAVAVNAQQVRHGDAIVIGTPSPGFCGCMPMTAYGEVFDTALGFQRTLWQRPSGQQPAVIAFGPNGDLYAAESAGSGFQLVHYDAAGNVIGFFGRSFKNYPGAIAFDTRGNLVVAQQSSGLDPPVEHAFIILDAAGTVIDEIELPNVDFILDFDIAADGCTTFVGTFTSIGSVDLCSAAPQFVPLRFASPGPYHGVRILPNGNLLVSNAEPAWGRGTVSVLDREGRLVRRFGDTAPLLHITLDPDGTSFLAATENHIGRYSVADGTPLSEFVWMPHGSVDIPAMTIRGEWRATTSQPPPRHRAAGR
jgi:DNA-binding beta-propeller fold protein YncE